MHRFCPLDREVDGTVGRSAQRINTHLYSWDENAERAARLDECKQGLADLAAKSATERKFDFLNFSHQNKEVDSGTQFITVEQRVPYMFLASAKCGQCR